MGVSLVVIGVGIGISVFNSYAANENAERFTDIESHWAVPYINDLSEKGVISGYEDGTFRPESKVTNAEFLSMTLEAMSRLDTINPLKDSESGIWYDNIYKRGEDFYLIDENNPNDITAFYPNEPITREEAARVIYQALRKTESYEYNKGINDDVMSSNDQDLEEHFSDLFSVGNYYKEGVRGTLISGIMSGFSETTFNPRSNLTRAQAAVMIDKMINPDVRGYENCLGQLRLEYTDYSQQHESYNQKCVEYIDQSDKDIFDLFTATQRTIHDLSDGYGQPFVSMDFDDPNDRIIHIQYYKSVQGFQQQSSDLIFTLNLYLDKGPSPFEDMAIELNVPDNGLDLTKNANSNFIATYLFNDNTRFEAHDYLITGGTFPDYVLKDYNEKVATKVKDGNINDIHYTTLNGRDLRIARYEDHTSVFTGKMAYYEGAYHPIIDDTYEQVSCSAKFDAIEFPTDSNVTNICNESVNTILDSIEKQDRKDILIIDVRTPEEYSGGFIDGAVNIPVNEIQDHFDEINQFPFVMVYCQSGGRSSKAAQLLNEENPDMKIFNFKDGYPKYERIESEE